MFRKIVWALFALLLPSCATEAPEPVQPPWNILWITVEDLSPRLGCYGDPVARTPQLDQFAEEGLRFNRAFTTAGVCAPSRSAIITGMYQTSIGTHHMRTTHAAEGLPTPYHAVPPPEVKTFTEYLRREGYYCTNNVKTDYQFGEPRTAWDESSREAHWRNREDGQPFFSVFNFTTTHESQVWPDDQALETDPSRVTVPPYYPDTPIVRQDLARHYDNIAEVDQQVGDILRQLREDGLADDTIVFFFSDHGDGLPRAKRWLYDSGIHVPLLVRWPGRIEPGSVSDHLVSFVDLAPTVLALAGLTPPFHMQGQVFLGPRAEEPRDYIYAARDRIDESYDMVRAVRDDRYKYIRNFFPDLPYILPVPYRDRGETMKEILRMRESDRLDAVQSLWTAESRPVEELYDTEQDPHEIHNLIEDEEMASVAARLRDELEDWMERTGDKGTTPEAEMVERMWPGGEQPVTPKPIVSPFGGEFKEAVTVTIECPLEGATPTYSLDGESWQIYAGPFEIERTARLRALCVRYGYQESEVMEVAYQFEDGDGT